MYLTPYKIMKDITTVSEYIDTIKSINSQWNKESETIGAEYILFRGQNIDAPLLPTVLRNQSGKAFLHGTDAGTIVYKEPMIVREFDSIYKNYTNVRFENIVEKFAFMQHYGIPTRLLDWTKNSIIALFFAVTDTLDSNISVVWMLHSGALNTLTENRAKSSFWYHSEYVTARLDMIHFLNGSRLYPEFYKKYDGKYEFFRDKDTIKYPIAFHPAVSENQRLVTQKGMFTIHGLENSPIEAIIEKEGLTKYLIKLRINNIENIKEELRLLGITPRSVYPDLFGLAEEFKEPFWKYKKSE